MMTHIKQAVAFAVIAADAVHPHQPSCPFKSLSQSWLVTAPTELTTHSFPVTRDCDLEPVLSAPSPFILPTLFPSHPQKMEDWLYDEGDDTTKSVYAAKLDELRKVRSLELG